MVLAHSISMQDLQNTSRYEMLHGFGESGNGDGTYIDKDSIKSSNGPNGTKQIAVTQYVLMPAGDTYASPFLSLPVSVIINCTSKIERY